MPLTLGNAVNSDGLRPLMLIGRRSLELSREHIPGYSVSAFVSNLQFIPLMATGRQGRTDARGPRLFPKTLPVLRHQNDGQTVSGLVNVARAVKFGQQLLSCNGLRACCMGKHCMLETLQE